MADTRRALSTLQTSEADNTSGAITAQVMRDNLVSAHPENTCQAAAYASEPSTGQLTGDLFFPTDGVWVERWDGSNWKPKGPLFPLTKPADPGTWVNQGSATVGTTGGPLALACVASGGANSAKCRVKSAPGSTPYTITAYLGTVFSPNDGSATGIADGGLVFRESGTGRLITFGNQTLYNQSNKLVLAKWDAAGTLNSNYQASSAFLPCGVPYWLRMTNDGTNLVWSISTTGINFQQIDTRLKANFFTTGPDQVGYYVNPYSAGIVLDVLGSNL